MSTTETTLVHIRYMIRRDLPEVLQAERLSFEYAWTEGLFGNECGNTLLGT